MYFLFRTAQKNFLWLDMMRYVMMKVKIFLLFLFHRHENIFKLENVNFRLKMLYFFKLTLWLFMHNQSCATHYIYILYYMCVCFYYAWSIVNCIKNRHIHLTTIPKLYDGIYAKEFQLNQKRVTNSTKKWNKLMFKCNLTDLSFMNVWMWSLFFLFKIQFVSLQHW